MRSFLVVPASVPASLFAAALALLAFPAGARAQQMCSADTVGSCPTGTTCQPTPSGGSGSGGASGVGCTKDAPCDVVAVSNVADPAMACLPAPCQVDTDCGQGLVCHTETTEACAGGSTPACPPNTVCDTPTIAPPVCTKTTVSACAYPWQLPCSADADCGDGFACHPTVTGSCSGGGGTPSQGTVGAGGSGVGGTGAVSGSGSDPVPTPKDTTGSVPPEGSCTTTESFPGWCAPKATTCATDADCPAPWTCVSNPYPVRVSGGTGTGNVGGSTDAVPPDATTTTSSGAAIDVKDCQPPAAFGSRGTATSGVGSTNEGSKGGTGGGGGNTDSSGGNATGGTTGATTGPTAPSTQSASSDGGSGGGCSFVGGDLLGAGALSLCALGALMLGARRRLARRR